VFDATNDGKPRGPTADSARRDELEIDDAFRYFEDRTSPPWAVSRETFDLYLLYEILPSRREGQRRVVPRSELDAFLVRYPSGVRRDPDILEDGPLLPLRAAYAKYSEIDPQPVSFATFRELVDAGIVRAAYTSDAPRAPLAGVRAMAVMIFLASRQRMAERLEEEKRSAESQARIDQLSEKMSEMWQAKLKEMEDAKRDS
jgi:hypothetical protein